MVLMDIIMATSIKIVVKAIQINIKPPHLIADVRFLVSTEIATMLNILIPLAKPVWVKCVKCQAEQILLLFYTTAV